MIHRYLCFHTLAANLYTSISVNENVDNDAFVWYLDTCFLFAGIRLTVIERGSTHICIVFHVCSDRFVRVQTKPVAEGSLAPGDVTL